MTFVSTFLLCALSAVYLGTAAVRAESHTLKFINNCGTGVPTLVQNGQKVPVNDEITIQGSLQSSIGYLDTGCLLNGEKCVLLEMNLNNPTCAGCGPSVDLSLIDPHTFNVPTAFQFYGGSTNDFGTAGSCDGLGAFCADADCQTAFHNPNDNQVQRACQLDNINVLFTFCGSGPSAFTPAVPGSLSNIDSANPNPPAQTEQPTTSASPETTTTTETETETQAASTFAAPSAPATVAPPASNNAVVNPTPTTPATSPAPTSSPLGSNSNSSSPSRSGTKMCSKNRRSRRRAAGAHARAQDRVRAFSGFAHF